MGKIKIKFMRASNSQLKMLTKIKLKEEIKEQKTESLYYIPNESMNNMLSYPNQTFFEPDNYNTINSKINCELTTKFNVYYSGIISDHCYILRYLRVIRMIDLFFCDCKCCKPNNVLINKVSNIEIQDVTESIEMTEALMKEPQNEINKCYSDVNDFFFNIHCTRVSREFFIINCGIINDYIENLSKQENLNPEDKEKIDREIFKLKLEQLFYLHIIEEYYGFKFKQGIEIIKELQKRKHFDVDSVCGKKIKIIF